MHDQIRTDVLSSLVIEQRHDGRLAGGRRRRCSSRRVLGSRGLVGRGLLEEMLDLSNVELDLVLVHVLPEGSLGLSNQRTNE